MQSIQAYPEIGDTVAVDVTLHVRVAADLLIWQLAGHVAEARCSDERKLLVAYEAAVRVDEVQPDLVAIEAHGRWP